MKPGKLRTYLAGGLQFPVSSARRHHFSLAAGTEKKRTQRKGKGMGKAPWTKHDKTSEEFMAVKKSAEEVQGRTPRISLIGT
jgi:hypothetical protein